MPLTTPMGLTSASILLPPWSRGTCPSPESEARRRSLSSWSKVAVARLSSWNRCRRDRPRARRRRCWPTRTGRRRCCGSVEGGINVGRDLRHFVGCDSLGQVEVARLAKVVRQLGRIVVDPERVLEVEPAAVMVGECTSPAV